MLLRGQSDPFLGRLWPAATAVKGMGWLWKDSSTTEEGLDLTST